MSEQKSKKDIFLEEISKSSMYAEGTADYLKKEASKLEGAIKLNQFLTFSFPISVAIYATIDHSTPGFDIFMYISTFLSGVILLMSLWLLIGRKNNDLSKILESYALSSLLKDTYTSLRRQLEEKDGDYSDIKYMYDILRAKDEFNSKEDEKLLSDPTERKRIMFNFLVKNNKGCNACYVVPSKYHKIKGCNVCGNFLKKKKS